MFQAKPKPLVGKFGSEVIMASSTLPNEELSLETSNFAYVVSGSERSYVFECLSSAV